MTNTRESLTPPPITVPGTTLATKTVRHVDALTDDQQAQMDPYAKFWIANALKTGRMTEQEQVWCAHAVNKSYQAAKLPLPKAIVVVPSPRAMAVAGGIAASAIAEQKTAAADDSDGGVTHDVVRGIVRDAIDAAARGEIAEEAKEGIRSWSAASSPHAAWSASCAQISFLRDVCGLRLESFAAFAHHETLTRFCWWKLSTPDFCLVCERPTTLETEAVGGIHHLHREDGPALAWSDGFAAWWLHGVQVDEQVVMRPETQTIAQIDGDDNGDRRAIRIVRFGWERYLLESGSVKIDQRDNPIEQTEGILVKTDAGDVVLLTFCPSTGRTYALPVGEDVATCQEAQSWLSGGLTTESHTIGRT